MPFGNPILGGGGALVREAIKSPNYVTGVSGWSIERTGSAEFADVTVRGGIFISPTISGTVAGGATYTSPTIETGTLDGPTLDGSGEVVASGQLASANYVAGTSGWAIDGDGDAEFNDVTVRGSVGTGGALVSANYVADTSGWAIDGDGDAEFNSALIRGDLITGPDDAGLYFVDSWAGTGPGGESEGVELRGPDPGTVGTPAHLRMTQAYPSVTIPPTFDSHVELYASHTIIVTAGSYMEIVADLDLYGDLTMPGPTDRTIYCDQDLILDPFSGDVVIASGSDLVVTSGDVLVNAGNLRVDGTSYVQIGTGAGATGSWSGYEGMFNEHLSSGYMMMTNGTQTYIGGDSDVYIRPNGNGGGQINFTEASGVGFVRVSGYRSAAFPHYSFLNDTDTGMTLNGAADLRIAVSGSSHIRMYATGTVLYKKVFVSGLSSSSTTAGEALWHYNAGGDEMYKKTSTGRLKANQHDHPLRDARQVLKLRARRYDAMIEDADGDVRVLAPPDAERRPEDQGQLYDVVGLIAEEVAEAMPTACIYDQDGKPRNVDWEQINLSALQVLQDVSARLERLESLPTNKPKRQR